MVADYSSISLQVMVTGNVFSSVILLTSQREHQGKWCINRERNKDLCDGDGLISLSKRMTRRNVFPSKIDGASSGKARTLLAGVNVVNQLTTKSPTNGKKYSNRRWDIMD
ncbi:hypothetical protein SAY86_006856 [Trapa natans]|uniref:Uncharacterized protein n=1 Tax=Trapa natans TaxID=22666 RepID=A0AAN7QY09_TRANT|nr:hypothetical protein SAY86_006856 [Trapa natans]